MILLRGVMHSALPAVVIETLGKEPDGRLTDADFAGLPMPQNVWDNETTFNGAMT